MIWQGYLPANGFAEAAVPGLPFLGGADAPASVESTGTNITVNLQYEEFTPED